VCHYGTATLTQDRHCDTAQFNQQKAENREEDKTETASRACLGIASLHRTVSGLREAVWADRRDSAVRLGLPSRSDCEVWR